MISLKCTFVVFSLLCLDCSAQFVSTELAQRIERIIRATENVSPTVKVMVSRLRASEFSNYDAITITLESDGREHNYDFLLSEDRKTLLQLTKLDVSIDPYLYVMKRIDVKGRPARGDPNSKVVAVIYDDFQCPFCSHLYQILFPELLKEYGDRVTFIYKDFPLAEIHPWAIHAAVNANCLAVQSGDAYWDYADYVHNNQRVVNSEIDLHSQFGTLDSIAMVIAGKFGLDNARLQSCIKAQNKDEVNASVNEGEALRVSGTPTIFVNGQMIDGVRSASEFRALFENALQQLGR